MKKRFVSAFLAVVLAFTFTQTVGAGLEVNAESSTCTSADKHESGKGETTSEEGTDKESTATASTDTASTVTDTSDSTDSSTSESSTDADNTTYTITFSANGGVFADGRTTESVIAAKSRILKEIPEDPTMEGYDFEGWSKDIIDCAGYADGTCGTSNTDNVGSTGNTGSTDSTSDNRYSTIDMSTYVADGDATLYAVWESKDKSGKTSQNGYIPDAFYYAQNEIEDSSFYAQSSDDTIGVQVKLKADQLSGRALYSMVNDFRTSTKEAWLLNESGIKEYCDSLSKLQWDPELEQAALQRAAEIALSYSHTRPNGESCFTAYDHSSAGENIAIGYTSAGSVFEGWKETYANYNGQGHRRNMLSAKYTVTGMACVEIGGVKCWVQEFRNTASEDSTYDIDAKNASASNNKVTAFNIDVAKSAISSLNITGASASSFSVYTGETADLPDITAKLAMVRKWSNAGVAIVLIPGDQFSWAISNSRLASFANGQLTGLSAGKGTVTAGITARGTAYRKKFALTVLQKVTGVSLPGKITVALRKTPKTKLTATIKPSDASDKKITWKSSDKSVATVSADGTITPLKSGSTTITVTTDDGGYTAGCLVTVVVPATSIKLDRDAIVLTLNDEKASTANLSAVISPKNASNKGVSWKSGTPKVAEVDQNGLVKALKVGNAVITATSNDGGYKAACDVQVVNKEAMSSVITADPESGSNVTDGTEVLLSCDQNKAKIYYTTDNSLPTTTSTIYNSSDPVEVTGTVGSAFTIKAIAVKDGMEPTKVQQFSYTIIADGDAWGDIKAEDQTELGNDSANIPDGLWMAEVPSDVDYTGKAYVFSDDAIRVYDGNSMLKSGIDYTVRYSNNVSAYTKENAEAGSVKAPTITVTGRGNYNGSDKKTFYINPIDISDKNDAVETYTIYEKYDGKMHKSKPVVSWKGRTLTGSEYKVSYPDFPEDKAEAKTTTAYKAAGEYIVRITGKGNFEGTRDVKLVITDTGAGNGTTLLKQLRVSGTIPAQEYKGTGKEAVNTEMLAGYFTDKTASGGAAARVKLNDTTQRPAKTLIYGTDYEIVSIRNNTDIGNTSVVLEGKDGYSGTIELNFKIVQSQPISKAKLDIKSSYMYTGSAIDPIGDALLGDGMTGVRPYFRAGSGKKYLTYEAGSETDNDFSYTISDNVNAGKATITITGKGAYEGTLVKTFSIAQIDFSKVASYEMIAGPVNERWEVPYAKGGEIPEINAVVKGIHLVQNVDFTVSCSGRDSAGAERKVIIAGKGNYKGKYTLRDTVTIQRQDISLLNLSVSDKTYIFKTGAWKSSPVVTDLSGKTLTSGTDYAVKYMYDEGTLVKTQEGKKIKNVYRRADTEIKNNDILPAGAVVKVIITGRGNYATGADTEQVLTGRYNIVAADISKANMTVAPQVYSGRSICPVKKRSEPQDPNKPVIKLSGSVTTDDYEIVGYGNNVNKGIATVTVRGVGNYGGTKKISFKIGTKKFLWWIL